MRYTVQRVGGFYPEDDPLIYLHSFPSNALLSCRSVPASPFCGRARNVHGFARRLRCHRRRVRDQLLLFHHLHCLVGWQRKVCEAVSTGVRHRATLGKPLIPEFADVRVFPILSGSDLRKLKALRVRPDRCTAVHETVVPKDSVSP